MAQKIAEDRYYDLAEDTVNDLDTLINKFVGSPVKINYLYQGDLKLKALLKVNKIPDKYAFRFDSPVLIEVNELLWDELCVDEEAIEILVREACSGLLINTDTGKVTTSTKNDFKSSKGVLEKFEYEVVSRAKELAELTLQQIADRDKDAESDSDIDISQ